MGRGRAKAKQTKVARELKYHTLDTDFTALQRELSSEEQAAVDAAERDAEEDDTSAPYAYDEDEPASGRR